MDNTVVNDKSGAKLSDKAVKMMGLSTEQLMTAFIQSTEGALDPKQWSFFWEAIRAHPHRKGSEVLARLCGYFIATNNNEFKIPYPIQRLLNTILFFCLWFPIGDSSSSTSSSLKRSMDQWKRKIELISSKRTLTGADRVYRLLNARLTSCENMMDILCEWVFKIDWDSHLEQSESLYTFQGLNFIDGVMSSIYSYLKLASSDPQILESVIRNILSHMRSIRRGRVDQFKTENQLYASLHIVRSLLSYSRVLSSDVLEEAMETLQPFYFWPAPCSRMVKITLDRLKNEILAPCNSILESFASESRVPELTGFPLDEPGCLQRSRPLFYIVDENDRHSERMYWHLNMFRSTRFFDTDSHPAVDGNVISPAVQALLFLNIISEDSMFTTRDTHAISRVPEQAIAELFEESVFVLEECMSKSKEDAFSYRSEKFEELRQDLLATSNANKALENEGVSGLPMNINPSVTPPLGPIAHLGILDSTVDHSQELPSKEEIRTLGFTPYGQGPIFHQIKNVLTKYKKITNIDDPVELRFCLTGGDALISRFVSAYMAIFTQFPKLLVGTIIRIFLVPFESSALASYVARHDSWYNRHILVPFQPSAQLLPQVQFDSEYVSFTDPDSRSKETLPASLYLRDLVENYVREAVHVLPVRLYKVEIWFQPKEDTRMKIGTEMVDMADVVVPLVQSIEFGVLAETNGKTFEFVDLRVGFVKVDLMGNRVEMQTKVSTQTPVSYSRISISNYSSSSTTGTHPSPKDVALEMMARPIDPKKQRGVHRTWCHTDPHQHIVKAEIMAGVTHDRFKVLVDGTLFENIYELKISPIEVDGRHLSLPISTFFPIDV